MVEFSGDIRRLLPSYIRSLNGVRLAQDRTRARAAEERGSDLDRLRDMEADLHFEMRWMRTGANPAEKRAVRSAHEHHEYCLEGWQLDRLAHKAGRYLVQPESMEEMNPDMQAWWNREMIRLSTGERRVLQLVAEGHSLSRTASILGRQLGTVRQQYDRAKKKLRKLA